MGISALSFVELVYFATLHLFWKLRYLKARIFNIELCFCHTTNSHVVTKFITVSLTCFFFAKTEVFYSVNTIKIVVVKCTHEICL